jgi:hypothetical protein
MPETSAFRATAPPPRPAAGPLPSWATLKRIADGQRQAMLALLAGMLVLPASFLLVGADAPSEHVGWVAVAVTLGLRAWMGVAVYRLTAAMGSRVALLWAIGAFLPNVIGLVVLAVASARATKRLRAAGLKVGLLGAKLGPTPPPGFLCQELAREFA